MLLSNTDGFCLKNEKAANRVLRACVIDILVWTTLTKYFGSSS